MKNITKFLFSAIFGAAAFAGASGLGDFSKVSEQEIIDFNPSILNEKAEKTKTMDYKFDIQTIKFYEEVAEVPEREEIDEYGETIIIPAIPAVLAHYDYETTTHAKKITDKEWNHCRETKTLKECQTEVSQIVADSKTYQIEKERERFKQLQDDLNRTDYFNELTK